MNTIHIHLSPFGSDHDFGMFIASCSKLFNLLMGCHKNKLNVMAKILCEEPRYFVVLESGNKTPKPEIFYLQNVFSLKLYEKFTLISSYAFILCEVQFELCSHTNFYTVSHSFRTRTIFDYVHYWRKICIPNGIVCIES